MKLFYDWQTFFLPLHSVGGYIHIMRMDQALPESMEQTSSEIEVINLLRGFCEKLRKGDDVNISEAAIGQIKRFDNRLSELQRNKQRFGKRKVQPV